MVRPECLFIINPQGGSGKAKTQWEKIRANVRTTLSEKYNIVERYTQAQGDATQISRQAVLQGVDCIVAVGGDGTTNEVANGFFEQGKPIWDQSATPQPCPTKLAIVPLVTGSDLIRSLNLNSNLNSAIQRINNGETTCIDVGILRATNNEGNFENRAFLNVTSCGMGALTCMHAKKLPGWLPGPIAYHLAVFTGLLSYREQPVNIRIYNNNIINNSNNNNNNNQDINNFSEQVHMNNATLISVCNGQYFGGGMKVAPGANMSDGKLDLATFDNFGFLKFAQSGHHLRNGTYLDKNGKFVANGISRKLGSKIELEAEDVKQKEQLMFEVDGEVWGRLPASIDIIPKALKVII